MEYQCSVCLEHKSDMEFNSPETKWFPICVDCKQNNNTIVKVNQFMKDYLLKKYYKYPDVIQDIENYED